MLPLYLTFGIYCHMPTCVAVLSGFNCSLRAITLFYAYAIMVHYTSWFGKGRNHMDGIPISHGRNGRNDQLGETLTLLSVALANAVARELSKEDIFILAAFLSSVAANLYVITNTRLTFTASGTPVREGETETGV